MAHSPSPWHINESYADCVPTIYDAEGGPVIEPCPCTYEAEMPDIKRDDLLLMAAAPDLLEVLQEIVDATSLGGSGHPLELKAKQAIAKATAGE